MCVHCCGCSHQYMAGTAKYWEVWDEEVAMLEKEVKSHPDVIDDNYPDWWMIDKDGYRWLQAYNLFQSLLFVLSSLCALSSNISPQISYRVH